MADCGLEAVLAELKLEPVALTDIQRDVVNQWKRYSADLMVYCEELLEYGIIGNGKIEPKQPKITLDTALKDGRSKQKALTGDNLHQYLLQYIARRLATECNSCSSESPKEWICLLATTELFVFVRCHRIWLLVECGL